MPLLSAHRGGPEGVLPPNSLAAIEAAVGLGVDLVEFDVRITADGVLVVTDGPTVATPAGAQPVGALSAAEVYAGQPTAAPLDAVLPLLRGRAIAHVDLKQPGTEVVIADACARVLGADGFLVTTMDDASVRTLRTTRPQVRVALSIGRDGRGLGPVETVRLRLSELFPGRRVAACGATMLAVNVSLPRVGLLRWAARHDIPVLLWTLNSPGRIRWAWRQPRVWAFATDYPRRALALRRPG